MKTNHVNILIPFNGINDYVLECIEGCLGLGYQEYTIVLLPDEEIILPEKVRNSEKIEIIPTKKITIAAKRNLGFQKAQKAEFYAFIDSDAYPAKDWLSKGVSYLKSNRRISMVGGSSLCPPKEPLSKKAAHNSLQTILVSGFCAKIFRKTTKSFFCKDLPTCNLIIKKETFDALKGFNEKWVSAEDKDFCYRAAKKKIKGFFASDVVVYHHSRKLFKSFIKQRFVYGASVPALIRENLSVASLCLLLPLVFLLSLITMVTFSFFVSQAGITLWGVVIFYLLVVFCESLRWSTHREEFIKTFFAIILGNLVPAIGAGVGFALKPLNLSGIYKNYES